MESSRLHYYFLKVAGVGFVTMCGYAAVAAIFFPGEIQSETPLGIGDRVFIATAFPILGLLLGFAGWRAAYVKIHTPHLEVLCNGKRCEVPWAEVAGISTLPFTTPPMYWIKFYGRPGALVIPWSWFVLSIGFWAWDFTKFKDNLEVRIAEAFRDLNRA